MFRRIVLRFSLILSLSLVACNPQSESGQAVSTTETAQIASPQNPVIRLATTTSTENSGLLDDILPHFTAETGYTVEVVAVGTGQALALGRNADADIVLVHARTLEDEFVADGYGTQRHDVMYNDFVIVTTEANSQALSQASDVFDAFNIIASQGLTFVSRGDDSGTHVKELEIWTEAALEPAGAWYISAGQGMGETLLMTHELQGFTLTDRGTYIALKAQGTDLLIVIEGDRILANPYGVIPVNPELHTDINAEGAQIFVDWLISLPTQERIANYRVSDEVLFFPDSAIYHAQQSE